MTRLNTAGLVVALSCVWVWQATAQEVAVPQVEGDYVAEEVSFAHGDHRLAGTLYKPRTEGPHPAIILLAGSGATDRTSFGYFPYIQPAFLSRGIAVLVYDKPGVGESSGDYLAMTLRDRAEEAVAAVRFLQQRLDIRADAVGLWGGSQGGWVAPLAATFSDSIAFLVTISAPGVTPAEQDVYGLENQVRGEGHPESIVGEGVEWGRRLMAAAAAGVPYEEVRKTLLEPAEGTPWAGYFDIPDEATWRFLAAVDPETRKPNVLYDPAAVLERVTTPYLVIFGEADALVPVAKSVEIFERALEKAGNEDYRIEVFPEANHGIMVGRRMFAPNYLRLMGDWVAERVVDGPAVGRGPFTAPVEDSTTNSNQRQGGVVMESVNIREKLNLVDDHWHPRVIAAFDNMHVKVAKIHGEFDWHYHEDEDELFWIMSGRLLMQFRDREVWVEEGELIIVPKGVEHCPCAPDEVELVLIEPAATKHTGNVVTERTRTKFEWI